MACILIHIDLQGLPSSGAAELCTGVASLLARLQLHSVRSGLLLQCASAADAAPSLAALQPAAAAAAVPWVLAQPGQLPVALRLALDQLLPALPPAIAFTSLSSSAEAASLASALGCSVQHLPAQTASSAQLQAWTLQAVAGLAAAQAQVPPIVVGYVMKESRQVALTQQGMLPLLPPAAPAPLAGKAAGSLPAAAAELAPGRAAAAALAAPMCFVPLDLGSSLGPQLARCHVVLQKLTDCLQPGQGGGAVAAFSPEAQALVARLAAQQPPQQEQQQQHGQGQGLRGCQALPICLVDPAEALVPIMDRTQLIRHLEAAALTVRQRGIPMRAPATRALTAFDPADTPRQLAGAGVGLPCIVKPQAACGVAEAHQMAFVLHSSGFADLEVPLPAVAQEYVEHGGVVWKVYVAGQQVFWTQRKSTPDLGPLSLRLAEDPDADIPASIGFDSLKSLPTTLPWLRQLAPPPAAAPPAAGAAAGAERTPVQPRASQQQQQQQPAAAAGQAAAQDRVPGAGQPQSGAQPRGHELMRRSTFEAVAAALRQQLALTLFGFDLVFDWAAGELVIIDVNYFPSFKGIPEAPAALQAALRQRYAQHIAASPRH